MVKPPKIGKASTRSARGGDATSNRGVDGPADSRMLRFGSMRHSSAARGTLASSKVERLLGRLERAISGSAQTQTRSFAARQSQPATALDTPSPCCTSVVASCREADTRSRVAYVENRPIDVDMIEEFELRLEE